MSVLFPCPFPHSVILRAQLPLSVPELSVSSPPRGPLDFAVPEARLRLCLSFLLPSYVCRSQAEIESAASEIGRDYELSV